MERLVKDAGCHVGQGWLYGRAVPAELFCAQLEEVMKDAAACAT
jgi:sensor c-di-GMP phosphodiesterase-like protein